MLFALLRRQGLEWRESCPILLLVLPLEELTERRQEISTFVSSSFANYPSFLCLFHTCLYFNIFSIESNIKLQWAHYNLQIITTRSFGDVTPTVFPFCGCMRMIWDRIIYHLPVGGCKFRNSTIPHGATVYLSVYLSIYLSISIYLFIIGGVGLSP
jgi:hypothetical protein